MDSGGALFTTETDFADLEKFFHAVIHLALERSQGRQGKREEKERK